MSNYNWGYPNIVWFGNGRINKLPNACNIFNIKKPLLVTDKDLAKTQITTKVIDINKKANFYRNFFRSKRKSFW